MFVTEKGQVTIPKHIRVAAGVTPGSEVAFSLEGGKIVVTPIASSVKNDRRAKLRAAAAKVRSTMNPAFAQMGAQEIMAFLRDDPTPASPRRARR
jgi:antitoxin PrlF